MDDQDFSLKEYELFIFKLIDHYLEIEEYKSYLEQKQEQIQEEVIKFITNYRNEETLITRYVTAELSKDKIIKFNSSKMQEVIEILNENNLLDKLKLIEGKNLIRILAEDNETLDSYKNYVLKINEKENKQKLITYLIKHKKLDRLKLDINELMKEFGYKSDAYSETQRRVIEEILKKFGEEKKIIVKRR